MSRPHISISYCVPSSPSSLPLTQQWRITLQSVSVKERGRKRKEGRRERGEACAQMTVVGQLKPCTPPLFYRQINGCNLNTKLPVLSSSLPQRCWRFAFSCVPQERKKRRRRKEGQEADAKEEDEEEDYKEEDKGEEEEEAGMKKEKDEMEGLEENHIIHRQRHRQQQQQQQQQQQKKEEKEEKEEGKEGEEEEEETQQRREGERQLEAIMHPSLVELCFHRHNPKLEAQTYLEVFHQMLGEGLIDRFKTLHAL